MKIREYRAVGLIAMLAFTMLTFSSCKDRAEEEANNTDYDAIEQSFLDDWMQTNCQDNPSLLASRQADGYYILFDNSATTSGDAVELGGYVKYNITTTDLDGNVYNTRNETMSVQQGTFNYFTRYTPQTDYIPSFSDYSEEDEYDYDAVELALMSSELVIDGVSTGVEFKAGTKFTLYMTSALGGAVNGSAGYGGQFIYSGYRPVKSEIEITEVMNYPSVSEKSAIDAFIDLNKAKYPKSDWTLLNDVEAHYIRLNTNYLPVYDEASFEFVDAYPYEKLLRDNAAKTLASLPLTVDELNRSIYTHLMGDDEDEYELDSNEDEVSSNVIGTEDTGYIWYIVRTLDGFIVDTNIAEVQWLIYGTATSNTSYIYYCADDDESSYISAWYYVVPKLRHGQWAAFLTTSTNAYTNYGVSATSTSTEIAPYTPLLFEVYSVPTNTYTEDDIVTDTTAAVTE